VAEARRLREARGARGVDVEEVVARAQLVPHARVGRRGRLARQRRIEVVGLLRRLGLRARIAQHPDVQGVRHLRADACHAFQALAAHDDGPRPGGLEGMGQRPAGQVRVEQRRGDAELGQARPHEDVLGPVLHVQGHDVSGPETQPEAPVSHPVRLGLELGVADLAVFEQEEDPVRIVPRPLLDPIGHAGAAPGPEQERRQGRKQANGEGEPIQHVGSLPRFGPMPRVGAGFGGRYRRGRGSRAARADPGSTSCGAPGSRRCPGGLRLWSPGGLGRREIVGPRRENVEVRSAAQRQAASGLADASLGPAADKQSCSETSTCTPATRGTASCSRCPWWAARERIRPPTPATSPATARASTSTATGPLRPRSPRSVTVLVADRVPGSVWDQSPAVRPSRIGLDVAEFPVLLP
jgi:hypothetical protein